MTGSTELPDDWQPALTPKFVVAGAGPVGRAVAMRLRANNPHADVTMVGLNDPAPIRGVKQVKADINDGHSLVELCQGAVCLISALNPPDFDQWPEQWPPLLEATLKAAEATGATLAMVGNLYPYGPSSEPITAQTPEAPVSQHGQVRAANWAKALDWHQAGRVKVFEMRAADFMQTQPSSVIGMALRRVPHGRTGYYLGDPTQLHSWTFIPDLAEALVAAVDQPEAYGRVWLAPNAPPISVVDAAKDVAAAGGWVLPPIRPVTKAVLSTVKVLSKEARQAYQTDYQRINPFVTDTSETVAAFGVEATPWAEQAAVMAAQLGANLPLPAGH
ncbi:MAG: NAD-dependent epimerase/dehydratase family protein [Micrococcales bacterium]|nr:NAD-dependent epimerase/dehydratase family protein [Micrococcales bacterium]